MALENPLWLQPNVGDPAITYTGQQNRVLFDVMSFLPGVTLAGDLKVTQRAAGAAMSVDIAPGSAIVPGGTITYQGKYLVRSTAVESVTIAAAPGTGSRTDTIIARVYDNQADGLGLYTWRPEVITGGTSLASASYIPLATVTVAAGAVSIVNANISDHVRLLNTLGDVPMWEVSGGNGQAIPPAADTLYTGWTASTFIGMDASTTPGEMVIRQAGRYVCHYNSRITVGGTSGTERHGFIQQRRAGAVIRRAGQSANSAGLTGGNPLSTSTMLRCQVGDIVRAMNYQNSGVQLNLDDSLKELSFTGVWVGP